MNPETKAKSASGRASIGFLLARSHGLIRARMIAALDKGALGGGASGEGALHLGHVALLSSLLAENDQTQTQLVQGTGIEKSSVVLFLDALESGGWIE